MNENDDFSKRCDAASFLLTEFMQLGISYRVLVAVFTKKFAEIILNQPDPHRAKDQFLKNFDKLFKILESQSRQAENSTDSHTESPDH